LKREDRVSQKRKFEEGGEEEGSGGSGAEEQQQQKLFASSIYISLQLCKMSDARASHINAKEGTIKAQNTIKQGQLNKAIKCPSDGVVGRLVQKVPGIR
jgi:hypothetical protein